ncbi:MAG TPA: hypothetical protein VEB42_09925, partial [Chitinophagaceae bacterium]|nr:hypothetical protein [Chitinophagaceae bacterium]
YQVVNSGGIGATYYEGMYTLTGDTIVLKGLDKGSPFSSNRLLIHRYSTSIPDTARFEQGQMLHGESASGEVYPLDEKNQFKNDFYFYIVLDSLKH